MPPKRRAPKVDAPKRVVEEESEEDIPVKKNQRAKPAAKKREASEEVENEESEEVIPVKKNQRAKPAAKKKGAPKEVEDEESEEDIPVKKNQRAKPAAKKKGAPKEVEEEEVEEDIPVKKKRGAKPAAKKTETKAAPLNKTETKWDNITFDCDKKNKEGKAHNLKITSWNVDGIRSWLNKDGSSIITHSKPDVFCLQETRCGTEKLPEELTTVDDYHVYWCPSQKEGYAGVGVYSKIVPLDIIYGIGNDEHDNEGRCITCEYDGFYLVNVYVPNAGRGLKTLPKRLEWNELFKAFIKKLDKKKPVIVCGDMNVAHNEIDLSNPKNNKKNAGFTQEERDGMTDFLKDGGFVDTFRELYPEEKDVYTFWSYITKARAKNVGWRLDYFIVSKRISGKVCDNVVNKDVFGSDHCPITLFINI